MPMDWRLARDYAARDGDATACEALIKYQKFSFDANSVRRWFRLLGKS
jgi:hypothetical protein